MTPATTLALDLKTFQGLPLHPLLVHVPVILVPLALIGAVLALVRPVWRSWALPVVAFLAAGSLTGVQVAMMSGEGLQQINDERSALIEHHAQLAEQARPMVFVFLVLAVAAAAAYWLVNREPAESDDSVRGRAPTLSAARTATLTRLLVPLCALSVLTGALATAWVYRVGHTGAESVWKGSGGDKKGRPAGGSDTSGRGKGGASPDGG